LPTWQKINLNLMSVGSESENDLLKAKA